MSRPDPPAEVARQLRREAGFGCCMCGNPIFQYHHIVPWARDNHFRPEDMMILCPNHHNMMIVIPQEEQYRIKASPFNIVNRYPKGQLYTKSKVLMLQMGGNIYVGTTGIIRYRGENILSLGRDADGYVSINARIYNKFGKLIALINNNVWHANVRLIWDIESHYQWLKIRQERRNILLMLDMSRKYLSLQGTLWCKEYCICINPKGVDVKKRGEKARYVTRHTGSVLGNASYAYDFITEAEANVRGDHETVHNEIIIS